MENIGEVDTLHFDKYLVLGFSDEWLKIFKEPPRFKALIDDKGKLHLVSKKSVYKKA